MSQEYQIAIRTYQAANVPLMGTAVHHEIVFMKDGEVLSAFNGDPYNRQTGALIEGLSSSGRDALRVRATSVSLKDVTKEGEYPLLSEQIVFTGGSEELVKKFGLALEASSFINGQNLNYIIVGAPVGSGHLFDAQNSNSVASTLLTVMGLQYPEELRAMWAPGQGRILLPEGWKSKVETMTHEERIKYIGENLSKFSEPEIIAQVKKDPDPNAPNPNPQDFVRPPSQIFFNPKGLGAV